MNQEERLQQKKSELQQQWDKFSRKIAVLRNSIAVETRPEERLRLEHELDKAEIDRESIEATLDKLQWESERIEPAPQTRIFISYKRNVEPDDSVARQVFEALGQIYDVFIDQTMLVGTHWPDQIKTELRQSDFLITFLSLHSIHSEMVQAEIETAHHLAREQKGRPVILPVRLAYRQPFPHPLNTYLDPINWAFWRNHEDTPRIIKELKRAISGIALPVDDRLKPRVIQPSQPDLIPEPLPKAQPTKRLEKPEGTMNPQSVFYVERREDRVALETIEDQGVTITIKAPRQMGKSSLLMRLIEAALKAGKQVAFLDFQLFDKSTLTDADTFFRQFCLWLTRELTLPDQMTDYWEQPLGNNQRCTLYVGEYLLKKMDRPLLLAMDEVDCVFDTTFRSDFFGMLRNWHNQRNHPIDRTWEQLDLALVTSTEPYQLVENLNQSPFNVGEVIDLPDFTPEQVADLNERHGSPFTPAELHQLMSLLAGHPYLTRRALYLVAKQRLTASELFEQAVADRGPFGDHLRHHAFRLHSRPELIRGLRQVFENNICPDEQIFFRLRGAGLVIRPSDGQKVYPRCQLYANFFRERLYG